MKRIAFLFVLVVSGYFASAQEEFRFRYMESKLDESGINPAKLRDHFLGDDIAKKVYLLKESYTYLEAASTVTATAARTLIDKPDIYNSLKKLDRYYKKGIRKGRMQEANAKEEYAKILNIALFIRNQQTVEFEERLSNASDDEEVVMLFTEKVKINQY
ncbi:MAG: hypothetical protein ACJA0X_000426 [Cyclobacteriaceae bacterium]|jgi:hypothetical protein